MSTCPGELLQLDLVGERDVFTLRQWGREVAALVGLEYQDQVRVATALSELARELIVLDSPATATLSLVGEAPPVLRVTMIWAGMVPGVTSAAELAAVEGIAAAARLTDTCEVRCDGAGGSVSLTKRLPMSAPSPTAIRIAELREACRNARPASALDEIRRQNQDLLQALETLQARQDDLLRVNAELEETNRGVLALHAELSAVRGDATQPGQRTARRGQGRVRPHRATAATGRSARRLRRAPRCARCRRHPRSSWWSRTRPTVSR